MKATIIIIGAALLLPFAAIFTLVYFGLHWITAFLPIIGNKFSVTFHPQPKGFSLR